MPKFPKDLPFKTSECLMNVKDVANYLGISQSTVETYVSQDILPSISFGPAGKRFNRRFRLSEINEWLIKRGRICKGRATTLPPASAANEAQL